MSVLPLATEKDRGMDVGLDMQERHWQLMNGDSGRASYHALPPIAALTQNCRPATARKEDHVFSVPNPPKPAGGLLPLQRAPTPFPDSQAQHQHSTTSDLTRRTPPVQNFPQPPSPSDRNHPSLTILPVPDTSATLFQSTDQRHLSSPHAYQGRVLPPSESANYPSSLPAESSRSSTPQVPVPSPSSHSGGYEASQRTHTPQNTEYGRSTPGTPNSAAISKEVAGSAVSVVVSSSGGYDSPRSFTPKHSPAPSPGARSHSERVSNNQISSSQSSYNAALLSNYPPHSSPHVVNPNPHSYTPLPSLSITRTFGPPMNPASSEQRYPSQTKNIALENLRNVAHNPTSYDIPRSTAQQNPKPSFQSSVQQQPAPSLPLTNEQVKYNYADRGRYGMQSYPTEAPQNNARPHDRMAGYFPAQESHRGKVPTSLANPHSTFVPPSVPRVSEQLPGEYANFQGHPQPRHNMQAYSRVATQNPSHPQYTSAAPSSSKSQIHPPPPQAVPYFRTDTSSVVWTTPSASVAMSSRPQDSPARHHPPSKTAPYQSASSINSAMKSQSAQQPHQALPSFYRHSLPQQMVQQPHQSISRDQIPGRGYAGYPQPHHQAPVSASSALPRINPPSVVNVTSTFTPRFSSPVGQSGAYYGASRVPSTVSSDEPRSQYSFSISKQTPTSTSSAMGSALPRVNFPSPSAVSFDIAPSVPSSTAYVPSHGGGIPSTSSSSQLQQHQQQQQQHHYASGRHSSAPVHDTRDMKVSLSAAPQSRHLAYAQVQSHAAYAQQQAAALHSAQPRSTPSMSSVPSSTAQYSTAQRQVPPNYSQQQQQPQFRGQETTVSAVRYPPGAEAEFRQQSAHLSTPPARNTAIETDSCRNPFELPPLSNYPRTQQGTSVIKSHQQNQRIDESRPPQRQETYLYHQQRNELQHASMRGAENVAPSRYSMPQTLAEPANASGERPRPAPISARFPPVPQMNYDLQRQIYDRMTGVQKAPPRLAEKNETERRNVPKASTDVTCSPVVSTTAMPGPPRVKKESPLDLSVKTVRQSADSTRDDVEVYVNKHYLPDNARMAAAPKIDFNPNFSNPMVHSDSRNKVSLPPVQTIRTFLPPPVEPSPQSQERKRQLPSSDLAPPQKVPKVDAWKLAMDEQIEERLKAARPPRSQPAAALTPVNPPMQRAIPTNPELLRMGGYLPSPGYSANVPPHRESPAHPGQPYRPPLHGQGSHQVKGRVGPDGAPMRDWNMDMHQNYKKDSVSISKVPTNYPPDPQRLAQQISQGVMPDSRLLHDRSVVDVLRNTLEEKEARIQQLQDAARRKQKLPPFDSVSIERMHVPPSYKHNAPRISENVKIGVEPTRNYTRPQPPERRQDGGDLDGLAAFLAARTIRTKAEMKQMGPSLAVPPFRSPEQAMRPTAPPPRLMKEGRSLVSPNRRRSDEVLPPPPPRDPSGIRSSSETSVFDFRESDSEGEMPVLERQSLEKMRRDRKTHPKPAPPPIPKPEPGPSEKMLEPEPDPNWENACDMFVDQLQKRPIKRSIRKKKPNPKFFANEAEAPGFMKVKTDEEVVKTEPAVIAEASAAEKEVPKPKITQDVKKEENIKKEEEESEEVPVPPLKDIDLSSGSSSEELPIKEIKAKIVSKRGKAVKSESEWGSSNLSQEGSSSSSSESSSSSASSSESESEASEPKKRRVQTRQQSKKIRPPARMKLRSKQRGASKKDDPFRPGWEDEVYKFKQQLRMPERLINISKPKKRGSASLPDIDSETESKPEKKKKGSKEKKEEKSSKKSEKGGKKKKEKAEEKDLNIFKGKNKNRPSSAPPLTRRNAGIITRGKEKTMRNGASAAVRRSNKAVQNSKRHLTQGKKIRRKFRSGFDYIRKKKKPAIKKDPDATATKTAEPKTETKRKERTDGKNLGAEVKSWVVNKGAGETVLHRAARLGYADVVVYLLDKLKKKPSLRDHAGYTPLHEACSKGHLKVAKALLQYGASVSESARGGIRPLHQAAENNYRELVRLLLSFGADPLLATYTGQTALTLATDDDVKKLITEHLADVQGKVAPKWAFEGPATIFADPEWAVNPLSNPPSPKYVPIEIEIEASSRLLPPLYRLPDSEPNERWVLVQDLVAYTQAQSTDELLSKLPGATKKELPDDDFRENAACCNVLSAPPSTGGQVQLLRYDDSIRQLMDVELVTVSLLVNQ